MNTTAEEDRQLDAAMEQGDFKRAASIARANVFKVRSLPSVTSEDKDKTFTLACAVMLHYGESLSGSEGAPLFAECRDLAQECFLGRTGRGLFDERTLNAGSLLVQSLEKVEGDVAAMGESNPTPHHPHPETSNSNPPHPTPPPLARFASLRSPRRPV